MHAVNLISNQIVSNPDVNVTRKRVSVRAVASALAIHELAAYTAIAFMEFPYC